jgi:hypothetical protein
MTNMDVRILKFSSCQMEKLEIIERIIGYFDLEIFAKLKKSLSFSNKKMSLLSHNM